MNKDNIMVESEVLQLLKSACSAGERFSRGEQVDIGDYVFVADAYYPDGCCLLKFPRRTIVEIKTRLHWDTLHRIYHKVRNFNQISNQRFTYVVICPYTDVVTPQYQSALHMMQGCLQLLTIDDLRQKVSVVKSVVSDLEEEIFIKARQTLAKGPNTLFLGAGVSKSAGLPNWMELIQELMDKSGSKIQKEQYEVLTGKYGVSLIVLGRLIEGVMRENGREVCDAISQCFKEMKSSPDYNFQSDLIATICKMIKCEDNRIIGVITYNYDDLIENELTRQSVENYSVYGCNEPSPSFPIYHVHGVVSTSNATPSSQIVFSERDYHNVYRKSYDWSNVEQLHALQRSNCFFIGLSMSDPNLRRLLDIAREDDSEDVDLRHFAFMNKQEYINDKAGELFCECQEKILRELGVGIIWYSGHENLPSLLEKLQINTNQ